MSRHSASSAIACFVLLGLLLCSHSGCWQALNPARPKLVPVSGQVLLDGEPVGGTKVVFLPQQLFDSGNRVQPVASALTDEQGNFSLRTTGQPGTPAGAYWVLLSKLEAPAGEGGEPLPANDSPKPQQKDAAALNDSRAPGEEVFPEFFNSATRLAFIVPAQGTDAARFELSIFDRPLEAPGR